MKYCKSTVSFRRRQSHRAAEGPPLQVTSSLVISLACPVSPLLCSALLCSALLCSPLLSSLPPISSLPTCDDVEGLDVGRREAPGLSSGHLGWHYLSNATCLMRSHFFSSLRHYLSNAANWTWYIINPLLKKTCLRQVALHEWFPLSSARISLIWLVLIHIHLYIYIYVYA